ncbi:hypothetical protein CA13_10800 [Planctomycetes bacterium CA13]|uniref:Uncharacterized protein n=1 Tax=Novipirellula herctigrandis TaxID=2527986 RepID=A0A5C5YXB7_9BACT|nr:hypothetical protein CA13_10800 [Planctomycetes bacterium CA13]
MSSAKLQSGFPLDDPFNVDPGPRLWRYPCGFVFGLASAGVLIVCTIPFVDGLLMDHMEYGPNNQLQDAPAIFGLTIPELLVRTWGGLLIGLPVAGIVAQYKPLFAALDSWQALFVGIVCVMTSLALATYLVASNVYNWAFLYM